MISKEIAVDGGFHHNAYFVYYMFKIENVLTGGYIHIVSFIHQFP